MSQSNATISAMLALAETLGATMGSNAIIPYVDQTQASGNQNLAATPSAVMIAAGVATLQIIMTTWINSLPTSSPGSTPIWWNNGGVITYS